VQGSLQQTGNPLDLAIEGNGLIAVQRPTGEIAYTRAGTLKLDSQGRMTTSDGLPLEPPISVPTDATGITIGPDGVVVATRAGQPQPTQVGTLQLVTFPNPGGLTAIGHNLYVATQSSGDAVSGPPGQAGRGTFLQGALESSNVEVVTEMIAMIRTQRSYEINSKVVQAADEMLRNVTQMR
jgi:flagellar basal-body rod protein FlgG